MISPQPWNLPKKDNLPARMVKPVANTVVNYGKLLGTAAASTPLSLGSLLASKLNQPKIAQSLAQGAVNVRNATGYNNPGVKDITKGLGATANMAATTYALANAPRMVAGVGKAIMSQPAKQVVTQAAKQAPQVVKRGNPLSKFVTENGRNFTLKGHTPTYELGMPTRVFSR